MFRFALCSLTSAAAVLSGCAAPGPAGGPYSTAAINAATAASTAAAAANPAPPKPTQARAPAPAAAAGTVCAPINESQVAQLFDRWNASLMTHDPRKVVENYAPHSILLPTVSNKPRYSVEDRDVDALRSGNTLIDGVVGLVGQHGQRAHDRESGRILQAEYLDAGRLSAVLRQRHRLRQCMIRQPQWPSRGSRCSRGQDR